MSLFEKLFSTPFMAMESEYSRLFQLLEIYRSLKGEEGSYDKVVSELLDGNSFLLLPSQSDRPTPGMHNKRMQQDATLELISIHRYRGLKVIDTFTDENSLLIGSKERTEYIALPTRDILKLCNAEKIEMMVINRDQPTMFILT